MDYSGTSDHWLDRSLAPSIAKVLTVENLLVFTIIVLTIFSRFLLVGERTMSHDEVNHVVPSYDLYEGRGYRHDPVTHGPFQFHMIALSYFLFGDNDTTSRIPAATFSTLAVIFVLYAFRRYLGRRGALIAGFLFLISPFMMFYGRYTRNEAFIELFGVIMLYAMLRYLDRGDRFSMLLFTFSVVMHVITKETSYIYTAEAMVFLGLMFLIEVRRILKNHPGQYNRFLAFMGLALLLVFLALGLAVLSSVKTAGVVSPSPENPSPAASPMVAIQKIGEVAALGGALAFGLVGLFMLAKEIGWKQIKGLRSFSLLLVTGTLILPTLAPIPVTLLGWNPIDYNSTLSLARTGAFVAFFFLLAILIGWWWNPRVWLMNAFLFYAIFTVFYTTFFTNGFGFFTGIVGALGYWIAQQGVERGSQPWYYFILIQIPVYEYLAALGTLLAAYFALRYNRLFQFSAFAPASPDQVVTPLYSAPQPLPQAPLEGEFTPPEAFPEETPEVTYGVDELPDGFETGGDLLDQPPVSDTTALDELYSIPHRLPVIGLLLFWSATSLVAYSVAGEKMPWLTVHIALPMLLAAGWGLGYLVDIIDWKHLASMKGIIAALLLPVVLASLAGTLGPWVVGPQAFQGNTLDQLQATSRFLISLVAVFASGAGILYLLRDWTSGQILKLAGIAFFGLLAA